MSKRNLRQKKKRGNRKTRLVASFKTTVRVLSISFALLFTGMGVFLGYEAVEGSSYFNVRELSVSGSHTLDEKTIIKLIGPVLGSNIFQLDLKAIGEKLETHPWIKNVSARRQLPGKLIINIVERRPIAMADFGDIWLMDEQGALLQKAGKKRKAGLPVLSGINMDKKKLKPGLFISHDKIESAFEAVRNLSGYKLFGRNRIYGVDLSNPEYVEIIFDGVDVRVIAPRTKWTDEAERLKVVDYILRKKERKARSIDLTFSDKVIVMYPEV